MTDLLKANNLTRRISQQRGSIDFQISKRPSLIPLADAVYKELSFPVNIKRRQPYNLSLIVITILVLTLILGMIWGMQYFNTMRILRATAADTKIIKAELKKLEQLEKQDHKNCKYFLKDLCAEKTEIDENDVAATNYEKVEKEMLDKWSSSKKNNKSFVQQLFQLCTESETNFKEVWEKVTSEVTGCIQNCTWENDKDLEKITVEEVILKIQKISNPNLFFKLKYQQPELTFSPVETYGFRNDTEKFNLLQKILTSIMVNSSKTKTAKMTNKIIEIHNQIENSKSNTDKHIPLSFIESFKTMNNISETETLKTIIDKEFNSFIFSTFTNRKKFTRNSETIKKAIILMGVINLISYNPEMTTHNYSKDEKFEFCYNFVLTMFTEKVMKNYLDSKLYNFAIIDSAIITILKRNIEHSSLNQTTKLNILYQINLWSTFNGQISQLKNLKKHDFVAWLIDFNKKINKYETFHTMHPIFGTDLFHLGINYKNSQLRFKIKYTKSILNSIIKENDPNYANILLKTIFKINKKFNLTNMIDFIKITCPEVQYDTFKSIIRTGKEAIC